MIPIVAQGVVETGAHYWLSVRTAEPVLRDLAALSLHPLSGTSQGIKVI